MMEVWAVYIVTNVMNGKQYVGLTKSLEKRWDAHRRSNGSAPALHAAIKKYGKEAFVFTHVCDAFDFEAAQDIERMLIIQHNTKAPNGYNLTDGGEGVIGKKYTIEECERKSLIAKKWMSELTPEQRKEKFGVKGRVWSEEQKEKIRASNLGKNLGKRATEETRAKMSLAHKARPRKPLSAETKEKIRQSLLGRKMAESEKPKHASFKGRTHTEETKAKIRASNIATKALLKAKRLAEQEVTNV